MENIVIIIMGSVITAAVIAAGAIIITDGSTVNESYNAYCARRNSELSEESKKQRKKEMKIIRKMIYKLITRDNLEKIIAGLNVKGIEIPEKIGDIRDPNKKLKMVKKYITKYSKEIVKNCDSCRFDFRVTSIEYYYQKSEELETIFDVLLENVPQESIEKLIKGKSSKLPKELKDAIEKLKNNGAGGSNFREEVKLPCKGEGEKGEGEKEEGEGKGEEEQEI